MAASGGRFFVVGGIKIRRAGLLARELVDVRDRCRFRSEFKLADVTRGSLIPHLAAIDALLASDAHIIATVVDSTIYDPFAKASQADWLVHADITARLITGALNRQELATVLVDGISTPAGRAFDDHIRRRCKAKLGSGNVVSITALDSRANDLLQLADLVAGAIAFDRRARRGGGPKDTSNKGKVVARLRSGLDLESFDDRRRGRVNIATIRSISTSSTSSRPARPPG